jgi:O-antigen/teichoic acid export membrane protein
LNILLATILAPRFGPMGMAISVVAAESSVVIGLLFLIRSKGRDVWRPFFARNHGGRELHAAVREL